MATRKLRTCLHGREILDLEIAAALGIDFDTPHGRIFSWSRLTCCEIHELFHFIGNGRSQRHRLEIVKVTNLLVHRQRLAEPYPLLPFNTLKQRRIHVLGQSYPSYFTALRFLLNEVLEKLADACLPRWWDTFPNPSDALERVGILPSDKSVMDRIDKSLRSRWRISPSKMCQELHRIENGLIKEFRRLQPCEDAKSNHSRIPPPERLSAEPLRIADSMNERPVKGNGKSPQVAPQPSTTIPILLPCEGLLGWLVYLAHACEMIHVTLALPQTKLLDAPKHERLSQYSNHILYGLTCKVSPFLDAKANYASLAKRYSAPVTFGKISSISYATLAHDVALEHVKIIDGYWRELHGGRITHVVNDPNFRFGPEHVAEIERRLRAVQSFAFAGETEDEKRQGIQAAFGKLIAGLRQEAAAEPEFFEDSQAADNGHISPQPTTAQAAAGKGNGQAAGQRMEGRTTVAGPPIKAGMRDTKRDTYEKKLPDSIDVRDLCRLLQKKQPKDRPDIEIAREFTHGNHKKAKNLYRQALRYKHLWK